MGHHFIARLSVGGGPDPVSELRYLITQAAESPRRTAWLGLPDSGAGWTPAPEGPSIGLVIYAPPQGHGIDVVIAKISDRQDRIPAEPTPQAFYRGYEDFGSWWQICEPSALWLPSLQAIPGSSQTGLSASEAFVGQLSFAYWNFDLFDLIQGQIRAHTVSMPSDLPEFLASDAYGDIRLTDHRISIYHIIKLYKENTPPEELLGQFPTLSPALLYKVLAFYHENQPAVDAYVAEYDEEIRRQAAAPRTGPGLEELRRRAETRHGTGVL